MIVLLPARLGWRTARLVGFRRLGLLAVGAGIGLLLAPRSGAELRDRIRQEWEKRQAPEPPLLVEPEEPGTVHPA